MKQFSIKLLTLAALLLVPLGVYGQKRIYTRSYQIQDFKSKTTKIVLDPAMPFNSTLRQEVTSLWTISPYEFCTKAEYEKQKDSPDCYFLYPETVKGVVFLTLSRGGKLSANSPDKLPITVVSIPITGERDASNRVAVYMPAYISLIQDYIEAAQNSEYSAYSGLKAIRTRKPRSIQVFTNPDEADEAFIRQYPDAAAQVIITPDGDPKGKPRYKMLIGTGTYQLYSYGKD
jgi:hypothetical protein